MANIKQKLSGFRKEDLLTICSFCKKIRINGEWLGSEYPDYQNKIDYFENTEGKAFSHGICPPCMKKKYGIEE